MENVTQQKSFDQVIADMNGFIHRVVSVYERDENLREDLVQDIALAIWQALPNFRGEANIKTFVGKVAINCCLTHAAKHAKISVKEHLREQLLDMTYDVCSCPEEKAHSNLSAEKLRLAVSQLPISLKDPTFLMLEGYKTGEIAEILGVSAGAISVRLNKARRKLAEILENGHA